MHSLSAAFACGLLFRLVHGGRVRYALPVVQEVVSSLNGGDCSLAGVPPFLFRDLHDDLLTNVWPHFLIHTALPPIFSSIH